MLRSTVFRAGVFGCVRTCGRVGVRSATASTKVRAQSESPASAKRQRMLGRAPETAPAGTRGCGHKKTACNWKTHATTPPAYASRPEGPKRIGGRGGQAAPAPKARLTHRGSRPGHDARPAPPRAARQDATRPAPPAPPRPAKPERDESQDRRRHRHGPAGSPRDRPARTAPPARRDSPRKTRASRPVAPSHTHPAGKQRRPPVRPAKRRVRVRPGERGKPARQDRQAVDFNTENTKGRLQVAQFCARVTAQAGETSQARIARQDERTEKPGDAPSAPAGQERRIPRLGQDRPSRLLFDIARTRPSDPQGER